jgi:hypothetical protein
MAAIRVGAVEAAFALAQEDIKGTAAVIVVPFPGAESI